MASQWVHAWVRALSPRSPTPLQPARRGHRQKSQRKRPLHPKTRSSERTLVGGTSASARGARQVAEPSRADSFPLHHPQQPQRRRHEELGSLELPQILHVILTGIETTEDRTSTGRSNISRKIEQRSNYRRRNDGGMSAVG